MKLSQICEAVNRPIRTNAKALESIISYLKDNKQTFPKEFTDFMNFLNKPTINTWRDTQYVVKNLINKADSKDPSINIESLKQSWRNLLTNNPDPLIVASVYDIDPKIAQGTPLAKIAQSGNKRMLLKRILGPSGWVSHFAPAAETRSASQIHNDNRSYVKNANLVRNSLPSLSSAGYRPNQGSF